MGQAGSGSGPFRPALVSVEGEEEEMFSGGLGFEEGSVISGFCPILVFAEQCLLRYIYNIYIYIRFFHLPPVQT